MSKAYDLDSLKRFDINVSELGCIMLDVTMPGLLGAVPEHWEYYSTSRDHWWVNGVQTEGHATLLYGLLPSMVDIAAVDEVLNGWQAPVLSSNELEVFRSPFSGEPYACIVARVSDPALDDAHARLSLLPHINTYPAYKAHVTLAYVGKEYESAAVEELSELLPLSFAPEGINYGHKIGRI